MDRALLLSSSVVFAVAFAVVFFAVAFFAAAFLAGAAVVFLAVVFLAVVFLAVAFFVGGAEATVVAAGLSAVAVSSSLLGAATVALPSRNASSASCVNTMSSEQSTS